MSKDGTRPLAGQIGQDDDPYGIATLSDADHLRLAIKALTAVTHPGTGASLAAIYGIDVERLAALLPSIEAAAAPGRADD